MPELRDLSGVKVVKTLERLGFTNVRQRGSHVIMKKSISTGSVGCVVPMHKQLKSGTLKSILKLANVDLNDFKNNL